MTYREVGTARRARQVADAATGDERGDLLAGQGDGADDGGQLAVDVARLLFLHPVPMCWMRSCWRREWRLRLLALCSCLARRRMQQLHAEAVCSQCGSAGSMQSGAAAHPEEPGRQRGQLVLALCSSIARRLCGCRLQAKCRLQLVTEAQLAAFLGQPSAEELEDVRVYLTPATVPELRGLGGCSLCTS